MRIGRIVAIGAGGALAVVGARKLQQAREGRRERERDDRRSTLGQVEPRRPLDPDPARPLDEDQPDAILRPVPETA